MGRSRGIFHKAHPLETARLLPAPEVLHGCRNSGLFRTRAGRPRDSARAVIHTNTSLAQALQPTRDWPDRGSTYLCSRMPLRPRAREARRLNSTEGCLGRPSCHVCCSYRIYLQSVPRIVIADGRQPGVSGQGNLSFLNAILMQTGASRANVLCRRSHDRREFPTSPEAL